MRISFQLKDFTTGRDGVPCVQYEAEQNILWFEDVDGHLNKVSLEDFDFTLHEKCEMPTPAVTNIVQGEIVAFDGVHLSMKQIVELLSAALEV